MSKIKAILFDNDGTIVDTEECILVSVRYTFEKVFGYCTDEQIKEFKDYIGLPSKDQFAHFTNDEKLIDTLVQTYREHNHGIMFDMSKNFEGLPAVLSQLKDDGYFMGIVTSKVHNTCKKGLELLGIDNNFSYIQGPDDWHIHKPDPGAITYACKQIGYSPEEVLYVGDSTFDIIAGSGAGCKTCAVLWGVFSKEKLQTVNPTYFAEKPKDLFKCLN